MPTGMPIMSPWANDHGVARLQTKKVPMNLIWSESAEWLLSSDVHKIPGTLITPMGMPIMATWANNYDVAHLQAKAVLKNLIWCESGQWLLSYSIGYIPRDHFTKKQASFQSELASSFTTVCRKLAGFSKS